MARIRKSPSEAPSRDAAEVVAELTDRLRAEHSDVATFDLKYLPGYLADLGVSPSAPGSVGMSLVGMGGGFVFTIHGKVFHTWEIENNVAGRAELGGLITHVIEGRVSFSRWPFRAKGHYLAYR
jgi:hypothetical protein